MKAIPENVAVSKADIYMRDPYEINKRGCKMGSMVDLSAGSTVALPVFVHMDTE